MFIGTYLGRFVLNSQQVSDVAVFIVGESTKILLKKSLVILGCTEGNNFSFAATTSTTTTYSTTTTTTTITSLKAVK